MRSVATEGLLAEALYISCPLVALAAMTVAALRRDAQDPTDWAVLASGMAFLLAAEVIWALLQLTDPDSFPTPGDYLNAAGLALLVIGLWRTATRLSPVGDQTGFVDATALALAVGTVVFLFVVEPADAGLNGAGEFWTILPLALDIAMLAMAARLAFALKARSPAYRFVYVAVAGAMTVDVVDTLLEVGLGDEVGRAEDAILMACFGCWAAAAMHRQPVGPGPASAMRYLGARRLVFLLVCASVPLAGLMVKEVRHQNLRSSTVMVVGLAGLTIGLLVAFRVAGLISAVRELATAKGRERFAAMVENASDVIITVDTDLVITYASPSTALAWGRDPEALVGRLLSDIVTAGEAAVTLSHLVRAAALPARSRLTFETRIERASGDERVCEAVAANLTSHPDVQGISVTLRDVTAQRALEDELRTRAFNDELTGLANRALFMDRLEHALSLRLDGPRDLIAVLYLDLDDFKQVNDGLGHAAGDELLVAIGQRLRECVRPGDTVARMGGDEFAILLEHRHGVPDAIRLAERIHEVLSLPLRTGDLYLSVRASIGIATAGAESTPQDLLRNADIAMYEAKGSSRNRYTVFDPTMRTAAAERISIRSDLDKALAQGQLHLVYQPIVDLHTGRTASTEALLRWDHPTRGAISPAEFVPIAEQSGQIAPIGQWVLDQACHDAASWIRRGHHFGVSVNASAIQFQDPAFADRVRDAVLTSGLPPYLLTVELTETAMMSDPAQTSTILDRLRRLGVKIAIDDFGTGYCSLAYVKRFAVDSLKIDRAFVSEVAADSENLLAHNILRLADSLGVAAVAEGIEDQAQLDNLTRNGCTYGQGFHLARPMTAGELEDFHHRTPSR